MSCPDPLLASLGLNKDQMHILEVAKEFAQTELKPNMQKWDADHHFPLDKLKRAAEVGFAGRALPGVYTCLIGP